MYFVHSYYLQAEETDIVTATAEYGATIHAAVQKGNLMKPAQFHPEKSGKVGLQISGKLLLPWRQRGSERACSGGHSSPVLDLKNGRAAKGTKFRRFRGDAGRPCGGRHRIRPPRGADELVLLDITASSDDRGIMTEDRHQGCGEHLHPLYRGRRLIRHRGGLHRDFACGGRIRFLSTGAALKNPSIIQEAAYKFGSQCVVVAMDCQAGARRGAGPCT